MSNADPFCLRCKSPMEEGFTLDHTQHATMKQSQWMEGEPEAAKFLWFSLDQVKTKGRKILKVAVWRCPRCGVLESYAH